MIVQTPSSEARGDLHRRRISYNATNAIGHCVNKLVYSLQGTLGSGCMASVLILIDRNGECGQMSYLHVVDIALRLSPYSVKDCRLL